MSSEIQTTTKQETESQGNEPLFRATGVKKHFVTNTGFIDRLFGGKRSVKAVDGVDIEIGREETLGLVGESGCGKTTLGRVLSRLYEPTAGTLTFEGNDITNLDGKALKRLRKDVQVIFQDPLSSLNPRKTVGEIVAKPLKVHDIDTVNGTRERVEALFEEVGLQKSHLDRYPHEFSGGQRQRVGIARALAVEPKLIIADEPVSALDVSVQAQIINLMKRLQNEYGLSYLFIAHDLSVVKHISDRVAVMYLGHIVESGLTGNIFGDPQHPYTRALLDSIPNIEGDGTMRKKLLSGNPPSPIDPPNGCPFHTRCPEYIDSTCEKTKPELRSVANATSVEQSNKRGSEKLDDRKKHRVACHWLNHSIEERQAQDPYVDGGPRNQRYADE